ncbi:Mitochondrial-processing peptidase subunit alpha [Phlyctochytrium bullatum]|nr:Mitochondrial-processing peptidase subunit alpha [Phlyctochytrium bullatum]
MLSTENMTTEKLISQLERLGGNVMAHSTRENMVYQAAVFRHDLADTVHLLSEVVTRPLLLPEELDEVKETTLYEIKDTEWKMDTVLPERLHAIAFHDGSESAQSDVAANAASGREDRPATGSRIASGIRKMFGKGEATELFLEAVPGSPSTLGRPLLCDAPTLELITPEVIKNYRATWFHPERMVVAGVGMDHSELVRYAQKEFGHLSPASEEVKALQKEFSVPAKYRGGIVVEDTTGMPRSPNPDDKLLTYLYIAFEAPSMRDPDIYALATLSTLMGGGGSFSAGGPGKGIADVGENFQLSFSYTDTSLFGITAAVPPAFQTHEHIGHILCDQLYRMTEGFSIEELSRAKNQLKSNLLMSLESRSVELEDIARQVMLQNGHRIGVSEMCRRVDSLKEEDLVRVARRVLFGEDIRSPLEWGDPEGVTKHWKRNPEGRASVLVHGPLVGGSADPLRRIGKTLRDWGLGVRLKGDGK